MSSCFCIYYICLLHVLTSKYCSCLSCINHLWGDTFNLVVWYCLDLAYDLLLVLLDICLNATYNETLLTWQSDICSIFHMVSSFHCIACNLLKCHLIGLHIIGLIISCRLVFRTYYILLSCGCLTSKFSSSESHIN